MTTIPARDFSVMLAALLITLTIVGFIVLWRRRSPSVHLWWTANLLGTAPLLLQAQALSALPAAVMYPLATGFGVGGLTLKGLALHRLTGRTDRGRRVAILLVATVAIAAGLGFAGVQRVMFSTYSAGVMLACAIVNVVIADRLARREQLRTARLLSIAMGIPTLVGVAMFVTLLKQGRDMLAVSSETVGIAYLLPGMVTAVANAVLFIGVVLEIAERQQAATKEELARARMDRMRLEERARLVADLHDGFGSQLTSARLQAERRQLSPAELCVILDECLGDLHLVVDTVDNTEGDIGDSLRYLRHRLANRLADGPVAMVWYLRTDGAPPLTPDQLLQLLRIIQEAISNALRHAGAREIHVAAWYDSERKVLVCTVTDDGQGVAPGATEGAGLRNMRGRASRLSAALAVDTTPQGTTVTLTMPLRAPSPASRERSTEAVGR